jgi:hypothetical protein
MDEVLKGADGYIRSQRKGGSEIRKLALSQQGEQIKPEYKEK